MPPRTPQSTTVCEGEHAVLLHLPIVPWVVRQA